MRRLGILLIALALIARTVGCGGEAYALIITSTEGGSVTAPGEGIFIYDEGTVVNLTAEAEVGYRFVNWTGNVTTIADVNDATTNVTMNESYSIMANFEEISEYTLTIFSTDGGSVTTPGEGIFTNYDGTVVNLTAEAEEGYRFVDWTGNVSTIDNVTAATTTITMNGNYSITANFEEEVVTFPDPNLEVAIRVAISRPTGPIYPSDLRSLTQFFANGMNIANLTGLECCTNLEDVYLVNNQISDVSPLANLTGLRVVFLGGNSISDISPLANLINLRMLALYENRIIDIYPLANLIRLSSLYLGRNQISDISALAALGSLTYLDLGYNQISDISPLTGLTRLSNLILSANQIGDISPLANLTKLEGLDLGFNRISDISPLSSLTGLTGLRLNDNQISDISPLANLTNLTGLYLDFNWQISDIAPLANLTKVTYLDLGYNQISDTASLANLTSLISLDLSWNQITNISVLSNFTSLKYLRLRFNRITDISPLADLVNLEGQLFLDNNQIVDILPLVENEGLSTGDQISLESNPLSSDSINIYIPQLQARGVSVLY